VRWLSTSLILGLLWLGSTEANAQEKAPRARQETSKKKGQVTAEDPTVMTVKGKITPVEKDRNLAENIGHGIRTGVVGAARGVANAVGWLLDPKNEIPSDRERQQQAEQKASQ
jgi:hypothetical protein